MSAEKKKRQSRPNRFGIGFLSILQIILLLAIVFFSNFLSSKNYVRADHSRTADYTLSSSSENYLESEAVRGDHAR